MYEGLARHDWDQTAQLLCQQHNLNSRRRRRLKEFHPYYRAPQRATKTRVSIDILRTVFVDSPRR